MNPGKSMGVPVMIVSPSALRMVVSRPEIHKTVSLDVLPNEGVFPFKGSGLSTVILEGMREPCIRICLTAIVMSRRIKVCYKETAGG